MRFSKIVLLISHLILISNFAQAQILLGGENKINLDVVQKYKIEGISVTGSKEFDPEAVILFSGLSVGDEIKIPGEALTKAIKNLWDQDLFSNVQIRLGEFRPPNRIYLNIHLGERPRLLKYKFTGIKKSEADNLRDGKIKLRLGTIVNENVLQNTENAIKKYFVNKGYLQCKVEIEEELSKNIDNSLILNIKIDKGQKVKIGAITFEGNSEIPDKKLKKAMKETKEKAFWRIFSRSKFIESEYRSDKLKIIEKYNAKGYRNAKILSDSVYYKPKENLVYVNIKVKEGNKFYFRNIRWVGNTKYKSDYLSKILGIKKGDVYNQEVLSSRLYGSGQGNDVSSLYLDDGYLSFNAQPMEVLVENDSIDFEIRIIEGKQYDINRIILTGNDKTNDRVVRREIKTRPGDLFSRSEIIRTNRDLAALNYFNPESMGVNPQQNPMDGTVDIEYTVEEKPSDQIELSGGWGAGRVVGTLGLSLTNFSISNMFKKGGWDPIPSGDGQRLSIRAQSNGVFYQGYNLSFTEPWLGGSKPNSFSVSLSHSVQTNGQPKFINNGEDRVLNPVRQSLKISGFSLGLGKPLLWPDNNFYFYQSAAYQYYDLNNFGSIFTFANGYSNNISYTAVLSRSSVNQPIYPRSGSNVTLTLKATPPYSLFNGKNYEGISDQEKYKFVEYHKWKFTSTWYTELAKNLVLKTKVGFGFLGQYNQDIGPSPFERFYLGGSALTGFALDGREIIGLRGYDDLSLSPQEGALYISKFTMELRYPLSLNPSATIFPLAFLEAGNTWSDFKSYDPFKNFRSGGIGLRIFLPMFGMLGLDYGWRFDDVPGNLNMPKGQIHFTIGANLGEL
ncbi:outer membrane protein assembly factor BamA [Luteibaculum oceani]|uniref:Outer membrane protein assembly factor BamA n=1 Tax=Luteibaculum oceani TaxID=1294296 RepID=A0A5C6UZP4_9FLAO|nr:outer membrane protein assembly factor BamA [Luteibaculum oceani]TXC78903.1 outer membrane protein assembly factor BamA [Luteibaculum oceani]